MVVNDDFSQQDIEFHRATAAWYDDETTSEFSVYHRYLLEPFLDRVTAELGAVRALDLGCGTGVVSLALAERSFDVLGIDHSVEMLGVAKAKLVRACSRPLAVRPGRRAQRSCRGRRVWMRHVPGIASPSARDGEVPV